jgi:UDP-hydrolysing UDP-N-acetyl-D-glucosamine 2-epimerase
LHARKRIAVVVTARPSYARITTALEALYLRGDVDVSLIMAASSLLERYGRVSDYVPFPIHARVYSTLEGANHETSAIETGLLEVQLASQLSHLRPDMVVTIADRHETLATAVAASYQNIPLAHLQGGEDTGSIDDRVRNAVSMLADLHLPATDMAAWKLANMGVRGRICKTGCPSVDLALRAKSLPPITTIPHGVGPQIDFSGRFLMVLYHPDTREDPTGHIGAILRACGRHNLPIALFWPGEDAGQEIIAKEIRVLNPHVPFQVFKHLPAPEFLKLCDQAVALVGNSSVGIRECAFLGTPVVNVGLRQEGRERASNVVDVPVNEAEIAYAIQQQIDHGTYERCFLYGDGHAGELVAAALMEVA